MKQIKQIIDRVVQVLDNGGQTQVMFSAGDWQLLNELATSDAAFAPVEAPAQTEPEPAQHEEPQGEAHQ